LDFKRLYGDKIPHINRIFEISNSKIGSFYSYNVTLAFQEPDKIKDPHILKNFETFIQEIQHLKVTKRVSSILDIIKDMHQLLNENDPEFYIIPDNQNFIAQILLLYEMSGGTEATEWVDNDYTTLRVMVEVDDMDTEEIRRELDFLETTANHLFPEATFSITGQLPIMAALNYYVSTGQIKSFFVALVVIMLLLMIVFKSVKTGLIGMIPNITPAFIVGGAMGHLNVPIDYVTMTMMPMILGLAVDDTIHFIAHAHLEYNQLHDYQKAIKNTLRITGRALFMTSFIIVAAFAVYLTANMRAMVNFGMFITLGISSALIADYLITPVCLKWLKPFGKYNS
jgi:predicted RND superfamily exporter protein